ncbi:hypothetical protein, partial [Pseudomonas shirazica]|uniref:hypothetical protein n=1 Tax=Pseudomonas shirazica TaxID=1940636 RepID=UPI00195F8D6E
QSDVKRELTNPGSCSKSRTSSGPDARGKSVGVTKSFGSNREGLSFSIKMSVKSNKARIGKMYNQVRPFC